MGCWLGCGNKVESYISATISFIIGGKLCEKGKERFEEGEREEEVGGEYTRVEEHDFKYAQIQPNKK